MHKNHIDPTPENFKSYEEAAEFWDTHDTTDYPDEFRTVEVNADLRARHVEIEIEDDLVEILKEKAKQQRVSISCLASAIIRQQLRTSVSATTNI